MIDASPQARAELAPSGTIRAAINTANPATGTVAPDGTLSGRCIDLASGLGATLGLPVDFVRFASAGEVVAAERAGDVWDVAFLAVDSARAERLHFSPPYLTIEAGFAVPGRSPIIMIEEVDRPGVRIATSTGAVYDLHLQRTLRSAERCPFPDPAASFAAFEGGGFAAVAGVRLSLERRFEGRTETRILPGHFLAIHQAMVVPVERRAAARLVDLFVAEAVAAANNLIVESVTK